MLSLSGRLNRFNEPETLKMAKLGRELRSQGHDIIDLSLGEPDFDTPEFIKQAAIEAIQKNYSHYTPVAGYADLREAVCTKLLRDNNLQYAPENIVVSTGAKQSIANAVLATIDINDEVIIPTPYWVTYSEIVKLGQGMPVMVPTTKASGYKITAEQLEAAITDKTRLFMFSSPCNPTGTVYTKKELQALVTVFEKHPQIFILSDEIYEYINYVGKHESIAQFESIKDRVIIINGLSKGYAMTGWRLGYIAAHADVAKACDKLQGQFTSGTNAITQRAAITALTAPLTETHKMVEEFKNRRAKVLTLASEIKGFQFTEPDGAFYLFPEVNSYFLRKTPEGSLIDDADDLCMYLLMHAHVSTVTGRAFGNKNCLRISYATNMEKIEEGFARIKKALDLLN
jgi:aspartate aminotransferase